jgi:cytochrome c peroxidase
MNWDNLNDGIGNPKNVKSLLLAHRTPPCMWLGIRTNAELAVRAGITNSLYAVLPDEIARAMDEYLKSLQPIASPWLVNGRLSQAAQRGKKLFFNEDIGCADCHKGSLLTDLKLHDVGTSGRFDQSAKFDTPSLIEAWRTAPYLHDGSVGTIPELLKTRNHGDAHGATSRLTPAQLDDLAAFVLSQ